MSIEKAITRYIREHSSYKYWLCFPSENQLRMDAILFWHVIDYSDNLQYVFVPLDQTFEAGSLSDDVLLPVLGRLCFLRQERLGCQEEPASFITCAWVGEEKLELHNIPNRHNDLLHGKSAKEAEALLSLLSL